MHEPFNHAAFFYYIFKVCHLEEFSNQHNKQAISAINLPASLPSSDPETNEHWRSPSPANTGVPLLIPNQSVHNDPACDPDLFTTGNKWTGKLDSLSLREKKETEYTIIIIEGWERKRERKRSMCFLTYIHLDLFRSHPSTSLCKYRNKKCCNVTKTRFSMDKFYILR